jgi:hypothetical protein
VFFLGVQVDYNVVHLRTSLVQSFVLLFQNFEELVQIIALKRFGGAPNGYPFAPLVFLAACAICLPIFPSILRVIRLANEFWTSGPRTGVMEGLDECWQVTRGRACVLNRQRNGRNGWARGQSRPKQLPAHRNKPGRQLFQKWGVGPERQLIWVWREYLGRYCWIPLGRQGDVACSVG